MRSSFKRVATMRTKVAAAILAFQVLIVAQTQAQYRQRIPAQIQQQRQLSVLPVVDRAGTSLAGCTSPGCTDPGCTGKGSLPGCQCSACNGTDLWGSAEFLMWWGKGRNVPPLITDGPLGGGTLNFFGGDKVGQEMQTGGSLTLGRWLENGTGVGITFRILDENPATFSTTSAVNPVIAQPFRNVLAGFAEEAILVASPGIADGSIDAVEQLDYVSTESFIKVRAYECRGYALDFITGYNFHRIDNSIRVHARSTIINRPPIAAGSMVDTVDIFDTQNQFHGGVMGLTSTVHRGRFTMRSTLKISAGNMRQRLFVDGRTAVTPLAGAVAFDPGGVFALPSNMGTFSRNRWAISPEFQFNLAYAIRDNMEVGIGYNFIWWNRVLLAGDQIDRNLNLSQTGGNPLVGPAFPTTNLRETEFWLQGINLSFFWNY